MWNNSSDLNITSMLGEITPDIHQTLGLTLAVMLALLVFSLGCSVKVIKVWFNLKQPCGILVGLVCQLVMMPLTSYLLARAFSASPVQAVAIIIIGSCPGGTISNLLTYWLDGDMDLSITMTSISTLLGLGTMPLNIYLYSRTWVNSGGMEKTYLNIGLACISLIVPVTLGVFVNYKWPKVARILLKVGSVGGSLVILGVGIASVVLLEGAWNTDTPVLISGSVFPVIGYTAGFIISVLARQSWKRSRTIAMETGAQNVQICGTVLQLFFPPHQLSQVITLPLLYGSSQLLTGLLLVIAFQIYKCTSFKKYDMTSDEKNQPEDSGPGGEINNAFETNSEQPHESASRF